MLPYAGPPFYLDTIATASDTYHAWTLVGTYTYVLYSGDFAWLGNVWANYTRGVEYLVEKVDETGLLNVTGLLDWGRNGQGGHNSEANALFYKVILHLHWSQERGRPADIAFLDQVLTSGAELATWLYDTALASEYTANASALKAAYNDLLWLPCRGMYRDNDTTVLCPQDGNSLAVMFNLTESAEQAAAVSDGLTDNWNVYGAVSPELPDTIAPFVGGFEVRRLAEEHSVPRRLSLRSKGASALRRWEGRACYGSSAP